MSVEILEGQEALLKRIPVCPVCQGTICYVEKVEETVWIPFTAAPEGCNGSSDQIGSKGDTVNDCEIYWGCMKNAGHDRQVCQLMDELFTDEEREQLEDIAKEAM